MEYSQFTAVILTIHNLSATTAAVFALLLSVIFYAAFIRKFKHRGLGFLIALIVNFIIGVYIADDMFRRAPLGIEIVQAGGQPDMLPE